MGKMNKLKFLFTIIITIPSGICFSDVKPTDLKYIEEIVVIGNKEDLKEIPGSGSVIEQSQIDRFDHIDLGQL